ncbi:MAG: NHL repeat protein [Candidatus Izimaplasma bacterium HR2]|nr:MAG: NHL repeat protein [Candidatus Izimaplasma bacterium HR2]
MKKNIMSIFIVLIISMFINIVVPTAAGSYGIPYDTYTLNASGEKVQTQTAYVPVGYIGEQLDFDQPQDMFILEDVFYIADTGNKRIVKMSIAGELIDEYSFDEFVEPVGVFVKNETIYVADKGASSVFLINETNKEIEQVITKPTSPIYGQQNEFTPLKVVVDSSDSIYVIGEGSTSGVIQLNYAGEFIGYLGINSVDLSIRKILYNFVVNDPNLSNNRPASPTNIALGTKGAILTTNTNVFETFKRLNITGINTLNGSTVYPTGELADIWMSVDEYIYLVTKTGEVYEYDANGNMLFHFNAASYGIRQSLGLIHQASGIVTDESGNLYILDAGSYGFIHVFQKTSFVNLIHDAVTLFNDGKYIESKELWEEILRQNSSFALAHTALGYAYAKEGNFEFALSEFYDAKDYNGYSTTFWEIRNIKIQENLGTWLIVFIIGIIIFKISKKSIKHSGFYSKYSTKITHFRNEKTIKEMLYSLNILKHPYDTYLSIRRMNVASYKSAWIVFISFIFVYLIDIYGTGFLFKSTNTNQIWIQFLIVVSTFGLYVIVNYLVSTLNDGEGRLKDIFIASSYALLPFIIFTLPLTLVSHVLTYNEIFIYEFYKGVILTWTILLIFISIQGIHSYKFIETIKNTITIIFGMFIVMLLGLLIYAFLGQIITFILSIIKEVIYRV